MSNIDVLYEDNHILIVNKPINIPVQLDSSEDLDLLNMIKEYLKNKYNKPGNVFVGLVHRLDRPVGGVMVFAKTSKAASRISEQIRNKTFKKGYIAVINGVPNIKSQCLVDYLIKDTKINFVSVTKENTPNSQRAELEYTVLETYDNKYSLINVNLKTGRPHQIRVQLANLGFPLYGDQKYGKSVNKIGQQIALWSNTLDFIHPTTKEDLHFVSTPPKVFPWNLFQK